MRSVQTSQSKSAYRLRAALSSPTANFDLGKTPGSSVKPSKRTVGVLVLILFVLDVHDGSDLSSLNASRKTSAKRVTPQNLSYTPSYLSDPQLLPILEEDHVSGQENINPNTFLPDTNLTPTNLNTPPPPAHSHVHQSTLAVVEFDRKSS